MAKRRMFLTTMLQSDDFLALSKPAQLLYIHLNLLADDDGIVSNSKNAIRILGLTQNKLDILIEKGYIMKLDSGLLVITHWHLHNKIRSDRYIPTIYTEDYSLLKIDNFVYRKKEENES